MLAAAVSRSREWDARVVAARVARRAPAPVDRPGRWLIERQDVAVYALGCAAVVAESAPGDTDGHIWGLSDLPGVPGWPSRPVDPLAAPDGGRTAPMFGRWVVVEVGPERGDLRIATDRLGTVWLYHANVPGGTIISADFGALAAEFGSCLEIDYDSVLLELAYGYTPDARTVFKQVTMLPAGSSVRFSPTGTLEKRWWTPSYGRAHAESSEAEKFRALDHALATAAEAVQRVAPEPLLLSISGGLDSRYILASLARAGRIPELLTFGDPESDEVQEARAACARVGRETRIFPIPEGSWSQWRRSIRTLGNSATVQWSGWAESWLELFRQSGAAVAIGYLGDALTGKHLGDRERTDSDWLPFWLAWSDAEGLAESPLLLPSARSALAPLARTRFEECLTGIAFALPHHRALHLDLYARQRRWVASQPNLISQYLPPVLFFVHQSLIDFWTNVRFADLRRQRLYLAYARDRFPDLFPAPEPARLWSRIGRRLLRMTKRSTGGRPAGGRPPVIDRARVITPNRARIRALLEQVADDLAPVIDVERLRHAVERYGTDGAMTSGQLLRLTNLMHLLSLRHPGGEE